MRRMELRWQELCGRYRKCFLTFIVCVLITTLCAIASWLVTKNLYDQQAAGRWAENADEYAQVSCFYPISTELSEFGFLSLHHSIEEALTAASITAETANADLFADAYSVTGKLHISTDNGAKEVNVVGVSDSFFLFHPVRLLTGSYFDENMIMKDGVILDEETAFYLYGSEDVVGMPVYIGNVQYYIRGVAARDDGYFAKKAGLSEAVCYVAVDTLKTHGTIIGSYTYEAVIPNPVDGFAKDTVVAALNDSMQQIEVVENSARFSFDAKKETVLDFGVRSMSRNSILYPYWENIARACEDLCGLLFVIQSAAFIVAAVLLILYIRIRYKNRTWTAAKVAQRIKDAMYERKCKRG